MSFLELLNARGLLANGVMGFLGAVCIDPSMRYTIAYHTCTVFATVHRSPCLAIEHAACTCTCIHKYILIIEQLRRSSIITMAII